MRRVYARIGALSTDDLQGLMQTPKHPDSQFALAELMRRGVDARPTKEQLFSMLTSGDPWLCMHAMTNLEVFYPELPIPEGATNLDAPDVWQARVELLRGGG
jgi:hypothetical protein